MERKIGETFEFEGTTLRVTEIKEHSCEGCYLKGECYSEKKEVTGKCFDRTDKKDVIFTEIKEPTEQPAPEEETKLNLCEKLKYCPEGTRFWSPMLGDVKFICILSKSDKINVMTDSQISWDINADATITFGIANRETKTTEEPMLFPSREQRDWSKVDYKPTIDMLPKTWEEFCKTHVVKKGECSIDNWSRIDYMDGHQRKPDIDRNVLPSKEEAEAHLALMQLHQLRDCWRQGWKPEDGKTVYAIIQRLNGEYAVNNYDVISRFLQFQDRERAEEFLECFRSLIEQADELI